MSEIKGEAHFQYNPMYAIEVLEFSVKGGTKQTIDLAATTEMSLIAELADAKIYQNISLALLISHLHLEHAHPSQHIIYDLLEFGATKPFPSPSSSVERSAKRRRNRFD